MPSFPPLLVVAVALIDADGRVLLQQRPPGKSMAGLWEFPGGKVEPGETPEAALVRELEEELGIETHRSCLAPATFASEALGEKHLLMLLYVCRKWKGMPEARHATALKWLKPAQMYALDMPPADLPLIGLLEALL
ncbi:(deoxy)nucleoside triphosphate pyrophosphohydrolase [Sphingobium sp. Z007]|uniref:(deoxy)nucleoside triphosphate pyrophosphohydrolase n=1 Tax=Sphingobium sp. Z007 TaxID=627495 RepID=UPI000B496F7A|nr:(deoxy)nucleoside triphosphate pyrophosphohydrolase [Sphingobium sp. Z007]